MFEDKIAELNSATKYPPIETYHTLERGDLLEGPTVFADYEGLVVWTEKVNGTNGRIVLPGGGDYYIGSREELWYAKEDRIINPSFRLVETLKPVAERLAAQRIEAAEGWITSLYFEIYGHRIGPSGRQYTSSNAVGVRLFDVSFARPDVLEQSREEIARWRDHGGQRWSTEEVLHRVSRLHEIPLVPRVGTVDSAGLPTTVEKTYEWLCEAVPFTGVALDEKAGGGAEGIVLRSPDRKVIAKARFEDYMKTLRHRAEAEAKAAKQK